MVIEVLLQLLKSGYNHITGIGIITPYDAQKRKIRSEVNNQAKVSDSSQKLKNDCSNQSKKITSLIIFNECLVSLNI